VENAAAIRVAPALHPSAFRMARGNRSETVAHPRRAVAQEVRDPRGWSVSSWSPWRFQSRLYV